MTAIDYIVLFAAFLLLLVPIGEWIVKDAKRSRRRPPENVRHLADYRPPSRWTA